MTPRPRPSSADDASDDAAAQPARRWRARAPRFVALLSLIVLLSFPAAGADRFRNVFERRGTESQLPEELTAASLRVLAFNTFLRPAPISWGDATTCRARRISERIGAPGADFDIAVLTESFKTDDVLLLAKGAAERFPYQRLSLPESQRALAVNGGLSVLSRYPIEETRAEAYRTCAPNLGDCFASKGILYVRVALNARLKVNVVATHLDAGGTEADRRARAEQLAQIRDFLERHVDTERWPTMIVGDMNIDGLRHEIRARGPKGLLSEYGQMLRTLGNTCVSCRDQACRESCSPGLVDAFRASRPAWSFDSTSTRAVNTMNCNGIDLGDCASPNDDALWESRRRLDYVLVADARDDDGVQAMIERVEHPAFADDACETRYLSDHRAVAADVLLRAPTPSL